MDWRLIAALAGAGGSFCLVAVAALALVITGAPRPRNFVAAPPLLADQRTAAPAPPPGLIDPTSSSQRHVETAIASPFAPPLHSATPDAAAVPTANAARATHHHEHRKAKAAPADPQQRPLQSASHTP